MPSEVAFAGDDKPSFVLEAKSRQSRRLKQKLRRRRKALNEDQAGIRSVEGSFTDSFEDLLQNAGSQHSLNMSSESHREWQRLKDLATQWITLYRYQMFRHSMIRELLLMEGLATLCVTATGTEDVVLSPDSLTDWLKSRESILRTDEDVDGCIAAIIGKLEAGLSLITSLTETRSSPPPQAVSEPKSDAREPTPPTAENSDVQCMVNGLTINLRFKNSGNNDINDIETYLQEKLDVLEFLQMDCNKIASAGSSPPMSPKRSLAPQTRMLAPKINIATRPQSTADETASVSYLSVGDWYGQTAAPSFIDESSLLADASDESRFVKATQISTMSRGGFFIGTPTSRNLPQPGVFDMSIVSSNDTSFLEEDENKDLDDALNDSQLRWETESNRSVSSTRRRPSRNRSSSVSSVGSSGPSWPSRRMMPLQQRRWTQKQNLRKNDDISDEDDSLENSPSVNKHTSPKNQYVATGWWN